jgi:hypothetical protein
MMMYDFPFEAKLFIYTRPNLRDEDLEMEMFMGRNVLESIYDRMEVLENIKSLFLSFPERWLNIIEQRQLWERLAKYCPNLEEVQVKTHSVFIIQCTPNKCCFIMDKTLPDDGDLAGKNYHDGPMAGNLFDMSGLNVVGKSITNVAK